MLNVPARGARRATPSTAPNQVQDVTAGIPADRQVRRHRIVEGDTIRDLAQHYLGDANRYMDLFKVNANVLTQPGVLPLGEYLIIPPAAAASVPGPTVSPPAPPSGAVPPYLNESPRPLLPVN
jgi:nucleoid-associated protein YgaU